MTAVVLWDFARSSVPELPRHGVARYLGQMPTPAPLFVPPLLLGRAPSPPAGDAWLHEIKYDGYRLLAASMLGA